MKLLLIEDDRETAAFIARGLQREGHVVDVADNGRDGLFLASGEPYDMIIVDRKLPGTDGLTVVRTVRASGIKVPIIFLTTMSSIEERVEGLEAGGDDYLIKPFAFSELSARIGALLRRPPISRAETVLRVADLEMDLVRRRVARGGKEIALQPVEFRLLEFLMRNADKIVTRTMLLERVWHFHFDPKTKIVEANISRLRHKIDRCFEPALLHTERGAGYVLRNAQRPDER